MKTSPSPDESAHLERWKRWDQAPNATFFQSHHWAQTLVKHFSFYSPCPLESESWFVPLLRHHRHGWLTDSVYGMPMLTPGGILAEEVKTPGLLREARARLEGLSAATVVLVLSHNTIVEGWPGWETEISHTHILSLDRGWDVIEREFDRHCRKAIRRAEGLGVVVEREETAQGVQAHWDLIRPQFSKWKPAPEPTLEFIRDLASCKAGRLYIARQAGRPVVSLLAFAHGPEVFMWQAARTETEFPPGADNLLRATVVHDALSEGYAWVNFGASLGNPLIERFKETFGAEKKGFQILKKSHPLVKFARSWR